MQKYERWSLSYRLKGMRYGKLTIGMAECEGLALVTMLILTNDQDTCF